MTSRTALTSRTRTLRSDAEPPRVGRNHVSTFIHCLHLLDLDLLEDWPHADESTFSSSGAKQNLQNKVRAVEWSLYRLFELYNKEEAKDKLRPFFPPTSSLQSVNLRVALFRCLTELKKNGVLGAQFQLRKTMLDDCKGEKFEELIAGFALIVLRKVVKDRDPSILESNDKLKDDQILPLIIALRSSLQKKIDQRKSAGRDLERFLNESKESREALKVRRQEAKASSLVVDANHRQQMTDLVNAHWIGNHAWADLLLKGPSLKPVYHDPRELTPKNGHLARTTVDSVETLVSRLDANINMHKGRLAEWKIVAKDLQQKQSARDKSKSIVPQPALPKRGSTLRFASHKDLNMSSSRASNSSLPALDHKYQNVLDALEGELSTGKSGYGCHGGHHAKRLSGLMHNSSDGQGNVGTTRRFSQRLSQRNSSASKNRSAMSAGVPVSQSDRKPSVAKFDIKSEVKSGSSANQNRLDNSIADNLNQSDRKASTHSNHEPVNPEETSLSDTSTVSTLPDEVSNMSWLADSATSAQTITPIKVSEQTQLSDWKIRRSIESPTSPSREWMSLIDRTRASMSVSNTEQQLQPLHTRVEHEESKTPQPDDSRKPRARFQQTEDVPTTLGARTRQSISQVPGTATKLNRRKSQRMSQLFPINQFETPGRPRARISEFGPSSESSTPREKLFEEAADYESVFKSRPKIALSPVASPDRSGVGFDSILEQDLEDLQLASDDEYD